MCVFVLRSRLVRFWVCFVFDSCPSISTGRVPELVHLYLMMTLPTLAKQSNSRLQFISLSSFILGVISAPKVRRAKWQLGNAQQKAVL